MSASRWLKDGLQRIRTRPQFDHAAPGQVGDRQAVEAHRAAVGFRRVPPQLAQTCSATSSSSGSAKLCSALVLVVAHRIVQQLALRRVKGDAGADAIGHQPCCCTRTDADRARRSWWRRPGRRAGWNRPATGRCRRSAGHWPALVQASTPVSRCSTPLPSSSACRVRQLDFSSGLDAQTGQRQLDRVLLEPVQAREAGGRQVFAVDPQVGMAAAAPSQRARCRRPCGSAPAVPAAAPAGRGTGS